ALFRLVESWGLTPDLLLGHSVGELAAAHVAGVLSLEDACTLVAARARLMQGCRAGGAMVSIQAGEHEVRAALQGREATVGIAAVNGPLATVIAGDEDAVGEVAAHWAATGYKTTRLRVSHAFHSPHQDGMLEEFRRVAESLSFHPPTIPVVSNLTGRIATAAQLCTPEYWVRQVREPVRFLDGMRGLETEEVTAFLELGPDATLTALGQTCLTERSSAVAVWVPALRAGRSECRSLTTALARLHVRGVPLDWRACFEGRGARPVELPTYAFQRQRYWLDAPGLTPNRARPPADAAGWRYRVAWKPATVPAAQLAGTWLVVAGASNADYDLVGVLTAVLVGHGVRVIPIALDDTELDQDQIVTRLEKVFAEGITLSGVLSLLALDQTPVEGRVGTTRGVLRSVALTQAWAESGVDAPLWCATQGAVSVGDFDLLRNPEQAMVWGLGRGVGLERPRCWGGLVDLPDALDERALWRVCAALAGLAGEDQLAVRDSGVFVRRVLRAERAAPVTWRPRGTVLITGGTGALGGHAARWLAGNGAEHLILLSRRGLQTPGAGELSDELTALGVAVTVASCDVADRASLAQLLAALPAEPPLTAVVHAAGTSGGFTPLTEVSVAEFDDVVTAKVAGAVHLDALLAGYSLDAFVLVSSIAGVWGSGGQAAYGAGNAFLDALAHQRRSRGLTATSLAWGPWAQEGMAADPAIQRHLLQRGLPAMAPEVATAALGQAVGAGETTLTIADVDWERFLPTFTAARSSRLFDDLPEAGTASRSISEGAKPAPSAWAPRLRGVSGAEREHLLLELVGAETADILGHATPQDLDVDCPFLDLGFDSLAAVELRKRLVEATGLGLATTVVFDHPTATALARYLDTELAGQVLATPVQSSGAGTPAASWAPPAAVPETVRSLYRRACELDLFEAGLTLLNTVAALRPVFHTAAELGRSLELVRLAQGPTTPALVCFPPVIAPCGPHNYARLALGLHGLRDVYSLQHPGFGNGESLPATAEPLVAMHAQAVARRLGDTPFAVVGYSSGGWFAHAVTAHLETLGVFPTAVVLLDFLALRDDAWDKFRPALKKIALNDQAFALMTDDQLTATAAYFRLFADWVPTPIATQSLLARASACVPEWRSGSITEEDWQASWKLPHETLDLPGDHFSIMKENVTSTALMLHRWLGSR
ncbi:MAG: type I polyketide synthase, partial [Pseudonocardiaceae bacterium]